MKNKTTKTSDAVEILHRRYYQGRPKRMEMLNQARINEAVARQIHDLRVKAGLTQRELAGRVGTTASVICRLEDADYDSHSLSMLKRIADALDMQLDVRFISRRHALSA
ncbi:MAG: helix-turn-helix transcriptional regulator [Planctomycetota bacterium]|nr:helix-turn-helix transcriptional regulator [Planctomycetota bacterium]